MLGKIHGTPEADLNCMENPWHVNMNCVGIILNSFGIEAAYDEHFKLSRLYIVII